MYDNYDMTEAFLEDYSDALLEMEENNNYYDAFLEGYCDALLENILLESIYNKEGYQKYLNKCKEKNIKPLSFEKWKNRNLKITGAVAGGITGAVAGGIHLKRNSDRKAGLKAIGMEDDIINKRKGPSIALYSKKNQKVYVMDKKTGKFSNIAYEGTDKQLRSLGRKHKQALRKIKV